ncbi:MAG: esterase-like activity of phytase family protein [Pseudotabrizicola sp.]|nr:esterase-like activity of phytase family protein [Pseudotabrizicola sp.]MDO8882869.1 esterase-like activity of phytase family protein [Pseudotabrizicola sp.]MDP2082131.1 esterase-like activity of phytase family protein [Pseudotabrizicola sp.]MDZ7576524.1 esterase-like activity of phytase family protein [Pseudotabrizicola sp.]
MPGRSRLAVIAAAALVAFGLQGSANPTQQPGFLGTFRWSVADPRFGGFSAIDLSADGVQFTALNDRGAFVQGRLRRAANGTISAVEMGPIKRLKSNTNEPIAIGRNDSEGIAVAADGTTYVSFEGVARVLRYRDLDGLAENLPTPPEFGAFPRNAALESLAIDAKGVLYTIPEELPGSKRIRLLTGQPGNPDGPDFPVWRFANGTWTQPFDLPRDGVFLPVSADFGPDGRLYVLERSFRGIAGFASRVRSFKVGAKALTDGRLHLQTPTGQHGNLEGLSVWRDRSGAIRLTMISDDNFISLLRTEIVEYRLMD